MTCSELFFPNEPAGSVQLERFDQLPEKPKAVLIRWFREAWKMRELKPDEHAEAFLLAWNALAGWAECVSGEDLAPQALAAVASAPQVNEKFQRVFSNQKSLFRMYAKRFSTLWPVFDSAELIQKGIAQAEYISRSDLAQEYLQKGAKIYAPGCWKRHHDAGEEIPVDLPHLLSTWIQMRRSLFQADVAGHSEINVHLVSTGYLALIYYLKENGIYLLEPTINHELFGAELIY